MDKTILIVDDDPNILDTAKDILEDAGYLVEAAGTAASAIEKLKSWSADLAILDFNLHDAKGVDLAIQARQLCPKIAVILMTGDANVDLGLAKDSVDAVLTKPVNPAQLLDIIQRIVDS